MERRRERIYVCHTFYHVYVACLKELNLPDPASRGGATLVLSRMSNDFGSLDERARACGLFEEVLWFDEKPFTFFEELGPLKEDTGSLVRNMWNRIRFCRRFAQLEEPYIPVDFTQYGDIYVFCDSDPIGYYLNAKKIRYHAVEDGLDCIRYLDTARVDNQGHFELKVKMSSLGLIFIQNGYAKYCIDMEVNDLSALDHPMGKMRQVPRERLVGGLTAGDRELLIRLFIANREELVQVLLRARQQDRPAVLILTEPLCEDLAIRRQLFEDMIEEYGSFEEPDGEAGERGRTGAGQACCPGSNVPGTGGSNDIDDINGERRNGICRQGVIVIKPHPRDLLDYRKEFPQHIVLDARFPMEILNFLEIPGQEKGTALFERVVTVYTVPRSIHCAREKIYLGNAFMDRYEEKEAHANVTDHGESVLEG